MAVDSFNDTFLGNAPVPRTSGDAGTAGGARPNGTHTSRIPEGVQEFDGTANLRTTVETKQGPTNSTPSGGKDKTPSGVESFGGLSAGR